MDQPGLEAQPAQPAPPPWASGAPFVPYVPPGAAPVVQVPMQQYPPGAPLQFPLGLEGGLPLAGGGLLARRRAADAQRRAAEGGAGGRPVPEDEVALAAREGRIEVVREWLAAMAAPQDKGRDEKGRRTGPGPWYENQGKTGWQRYLAMLAASP